MEGKMAKRLMQSMQEAVEYTRGNKNQGYETKIKVSEPVEIPERVDGNPDERT